MVRSWSYLTKSAYHHAFFPYREFRRRPVYRFFKSSTRLRRAYLARYIDLLNRTWSVRRKYRKRRRGTIWAALRFIPLGWARLYISESSAVRFYQSLLSLPYTSLGADPLVLVKRAVKLAPSSALSSFRSTKRITRRWVGNPQVFNPLFLAPRSAPLMNGILSTTSDSLIKGGMAAPWGLVYDNLVFSYNTQFKTLYYKNPVDTFILSTLTLNYMVTIYKLTTILTLLNTRVLS